MIRTIIIDDEPLARSLLRELLEEEKKIDIIAECNDGFEGLKAIQELQPDLVFLDIQMPKITGFEMLELLDNPPRIIFVTAFDEFALKAFEVNAIDYLLKPISSERLQQALKRISDFNREPEPKKSAGAQAILYPEHLQRIVVKNNGNIKIIPLEEVYYLESADDYVKIHTKDKYYLKHQTMNNYEQQLPPAQFVRIHRSYIINIQHIHKVELYEKDQYCVILRNDANLSISRNGYTRLKNVLGI